MESRVPEGAHGHVGVVLHVLLKKGPLGIHVFRGDHTKQGTCIMAFLEGTGSLNEVTVALTQI